MAKDYKMVKSHEIARKPNAECLVWKHYIVHDFGVGPDTAPVRKGFFSFGSTTELQSTLFDFKKSWTAVV